MLRSLRLSWVIAQNTYKEIIRDRLLYGVLLMAAILTAASFFLSTISFAQDARVLQNIGLASIQLFALFICVFVATTSINKDFERRALYLLFPKPISRSQYIIGKFLGIVLLLLTALLILGGLFLLGALFTQRGIIVGSLMNIGYAFLEISFLTAWAILFATFTAPLNAALYTFALFIIGHSIGTVREYISYYISTPLVHELVSACYYLLPNLDKFNIREAVLYGIPLPHSQVVWTLVYWGVYTTAVLALAIRSIKKQEV